MEERGVTDRRIRWSEERAEDWRTAIADKDRRRIRELTEEFGNLLEEEIAEDGGNPVLSIPEVNERIRKRLATLSGTRALDVGCGPTPVAAMSLADAGFTSVGIDIGLKILRIAATTSDGRVRLLAADGERLPFADESFDVITCDDTLEHALDQRAMVAEMARVMRAGGRLLLVSPNAGGVHVIYTRLLDLAHGKRRPRRYYHVTDIHTFERRYDELRKLFRPWFVRSYAEATMYPATNRKWGLVNRVLRLPGGWVFSPVHFVEFERVGEHREGSSRRAAEHYAETADEDSQTSPGVVREGLADWIATVPVGGTALDLGSGVGGNLEIIRRHMPVIGSEISATAAAKARRMAPVVVSDGARLPFADGSFGVVVCTEVLEHVDDPRAVFEEMARALRPGGVAYVTTPNYANLAGVHKKIADRRTGRGDWNPWGAHHGGYEAFMTAKRLTAAAAPWFDVLSTRGLDFGQALTGRFRVLDRAAWSRPGQATLRRLLPALDRRAGSWIGRHGMHVELVLQRR